MPEQNRYQMSCKYQHDGGLWKGWIEDEVLSADNWQDAIQEWIDRVWPAGYYTVVAETPSEDGKSGIIVAQFDPLIALVGSKVKATLIED